MKVNKRHKYSYLLGKSAKIDKSDKYTDFTNYVMYLAPSDVSGVDVCPNASDGCRCACLFTSGRGRFNSTKQARIRRTWHYLEDRNGFMKNLEKEVSRIVKRDERVAIRCNGTSDISWTAFIRKMHKMYSDIMWYDYTKNPRIALRSLTMPYYHVTFSRSESNWDECVKMLSKGINVAAVFDKLPKTYEGYDVINGDETDARFLDAQGIIVGLLAKGDAKKDDSGFVIKTTT